MYKTTIEVIKYGDFDILYTDSIMVSEDKYDVDGLIKEFKQKEGYSESIPDEIHSSVTDDFVSFLKKKGFKKLNTIEVRL